MTEAKKINEGTVTSLSDTDLVLASDSSGTLRPITVANLQKLFRDTLQIGGRNLIVGSDKQMPNSSSSYQFTDGVHSLIMNKGGMGIYKPVGTYPIESYTISVELKADKPMSLCWYLANNESSAVSFAVTTEWKRYKATLKPTSGSLLFRITSYNEYETRFYARYPKIERGNVATDWTPAPEDLGWGGGINARFTTTYDLPLADWQKGGQRERSNTPVGLAEIGTDRLLSFGSIDAACRFIGQFCEDGCAELCGSSREVYAQSLSSCDQHRRDDHFWYLQGSVLQYAGYITRHKARQLRASVCTGKRFHSSADFYIENWDMSPLQDDWHRLGGLEDFGSCVATNGRKEVSHV